MIVLGFTNLDTTKKKMKLNFKCLHDYCKEHENTIRFLWSCKKMEWKEDVTNDRLSLTSYVTQKLRKVIGIVYETTSKSHPLYYKLINKEDLP